MAKVSGSLILHSNPPHTKFTLTAIEILGNIRAMHAFVMKHGKDYLNKNRSTEQDRDKIENEVGLFVKACRERIEVLKNSIGMEEKQAHGASWLAALGRGSQNTDCIAHQHGVVLILSEQLHSITAHFDTLRAVRFQDAIDKRIPKRRQGLKLLPPPEPVTTSQADNITYSRDWLTQQDSQPEVLESQQELMDEETRALQIELTNMMDAVQETERRMLEMSALNHLFSTHVLHQAQQIELLYLQAVEATNNIQKGNKELDKTQERNSSSRLYIILIFCVLIITLLFLDWYNG